MLAYFFTCFGLDARITDLVSGGRSLIILIGLTSDYIVFQDALELLAARLLGSLMIASGLMFWMHSRIRKGTIEPRSVRVVPGLNRRGA